LLHVKPSTVDVDFTAPKESIVAFERLWQTRRTASSDLWTDGQVFSQFLPGDYLAKSRSIKRIGKYPCGRSPRRHRGNQAGRLDPRDEQDIRDCAKRFKVTRRAVSARAAQVEVCLGREETYRENIAIM